MSSRAIVVVALFSLFFSDLTLPQGSGAMPVTPQHDHSTSLMDFNGDTFADLAIGVPFEDVGLIAHAGVVHVLYGSSTGLTADNDQLWSQNVPGVADMAEEGDQFGYSLAAADFDGDGFTDLAIGSPFEDLSGARDAGSVHVLRGTPGGLTADGSKRWTQNSPGVLGRALRNDQFSWSLTAANFGKGSQADLAVGAPGERVAGIGSAGAINVLYGSSVGLTAANDQRWTQETQGVPDRPEFGDFFGWSLAAANFGNGVRADLAVGSIGENVAGYRSAGAVHVLYGSRGGLTTRAIQQWTQNSKGVEETVEEADQFGYALAAGDFGRSEEADLAVGANNESVSTTQQGGAVQVLYGSPAGISPEGDQLWTQGGDVEETVEVGDEFGYSLATANLGNGSQADLVVGVPFERVGIFEYGAGVVHVLYGAPEGLVATNDQLWSQDSPDIEDIPEEIDYFGYVLTAGDFGGTGEADLVISVPGESIGAIEGAGAVHVLSGSPTGVTASGSQLWTQDSPGIEDDPELGDQLGYALEAVS